MGEAEVTHGAPVVGRGERWLLRSPLIATSAGRAGDIDHRVTAGLCGVPDHPLSGQHTPSPTPSALPHLSRNAPKSLVQLCGAKRDGYGSGFGSEQNVLVVLEP